MLFSLLGSIRRKSHHFDGVFSVSSLYMGVIDGKGLPLVEYQ